MLTIKSIAIVLIMVGIFQAGYQLFLYFNHNSEAFNTSGILRGRITFIEPRTTLPFVLSLAILPLAFFKKHLAFSFNGFFKNIFLVFLILVGFFAGVVTLTRSIILSVIIGWLIFFMFNLRLKLLQKEPFLFDTVKHFFIYLSFLSVTMVILSFIPKIQLLEQGLLTRFYQGEFTGDYSNGRIYEEWIPAITAWMKSGVLGMGFGIGAGNTFTVATGEERTYIHNLCIYNLLYGGIYGLLAGLLLYFTVFKVLIYRAFQSRDVLYIAFAALLGSMFFYGQLFAVHKGLAFNAILFLIIALALNQHKIQNNSVYSYGA